MFVAYFQVKSLKEKDHVQKMLYNCIETMNYIEIIPREEDGDKQEGNKKDWGKE